MSIPRQNTVWGKLLFKQQELGVLSGRHLDKSTQSRINEFIKDRKPYVNHLTAPWKNNQPQWKIEDGKLYLTNVELSIEMSKNNIVDDRNHMQKIFDKDRLFAEWVSGSMKLLVKESRQKPVVTNKGKSNQRKRYEVIMDLLILEFEHGVLIGKENKKEVYCTVKNYIEEEEGEQSASNNDKKYPPSDTCIICSKSLDDIGGERIVAQVPRGLVISNTESVNNDTIYQPQSYTLSVNPGKFLVIWGEELQTDVVIEKAKREYKKGRQPWFCQVCGNRTCEECGTLIQFPMGSSLLDDNGNRWRIPLLPIEPECTNPKCKKYKK